VKAQDAVRWMQKAYNMIDQLDNTATPGMAELKRSILRSLARAYFISSSHDPENLTRADAALQELITSLDSSADHVKRSILFSHVGGFNPFICPFRQAANISSFDG